jgi:hypothetical protein
MKKVSVTFHPGESARLNENDAASAAIEAAIPGSEVFSIDPVDLTIRVRPEPDCVLTWDQPTPDILARFLYGEAGPDPITFEIEVPTCLLLVK